MHNTAALEDVTYSAESVYDPVHAIRSRFRWEHSIGCLFLRFPDERKEEFPKAFQTAFPNLEFQKENNDTVIK